ncbi:MAG: sigma-70 family RNA polymerase sigma factor [Clostridium sp.]
MVTSENFVSELKRKNTEALDYILDNYSNLIYKVAFKVLNNKELSEECLNTVLLKIWGNAETYNEKGDRFESWIFSISKFTAIDILRKEVRHFNSFEIDEAEADKNQSVEEKVEEKDDLARTIAVIESLGEPDNEIFIKRFIMDIKVKDIATALNMSEKAVSLRILRGKKKLKKLMEVN